MAFTTSGANANSYCDLDFANTYFEDLGDPANSKGVKWSAANNDKRRGALIEATTYIDAHYSHLFVGRIRSTTQSLAWPRSGAVDRDGRTINDIPDLLKKAVCELALQALSARLEPPQKFGGAIRHVRTGEVEINFHPDARAKTTYDFVVKIMSPLMNRTNKLVRS